MKTLQPLLTATLLFLCWRLPAQVPQLISYQGRLVFGGTNFNGAGQFKFALVNADGSVSLWSNNGTSIAGGQPTAPVAVGVSNGLYAVLLGDTSLPNMTSIPATVFTNPDVRLRFWFNDGVNGFQLLTPDQRIAAVGYAMVAGSASTATTAANFTGVLSGEVTGTQGATVVASVGGQAATIVASGATAANAASSANTANTLVKRDAGGNFAAGTISASLAGNAASATIAGSFSGSLAGDVTGTQGATAVASVGGQPAANVASGASAANLATSVNTPGMIVKRDTSGNFAAGAISTASVSGDGSGLTSLNGANISNGTVGSAQLAVGAVQTANIAAGAVGSNQLAFGAAVANLQASGQSGVGSGGMILSKDLASSSLISAGYVRVGKMTLGVDTWEQRAPMPVPGRFDHTSVWTGTEMIIWGGRTHSGSDFVFGDGASYNAALNTWRIIAANGAPGGRYGHSGIWTGTEMIIWGGYNTTNGNYLGDGARYDPTTDTWTPVSPNGAPSPRGLHTATWTGTEMIVWGGVGNAGNSYTNFADGARYNPTSDSWTAMGTNSFLAGRYDHAATWTGAKLVIWGGIAYNQTYTLFVDGGLYDPVLDAWSRIATNGAPAGRYDESAVWTGTEMVVWGGLNPSPWTPLGDGARYNPAADSWTAISPSGAPSARFGAATVWTGTEMIAWGGYSGSFVNNGGRYNPTLDNWQPLTLIGAPTGRQLCATVWTGGEMVISGGNDSSYPSPNDTFSYTPPATLYLYQRP
jgi:N-acetylneuraminic acid mutarotase